MNIVIIPAFFQEKRRPTNGSFFLEQAKALQRNGNQVTILYCDTYSVKCISQCIHYEEEKCQVIEGVQIYRKKCFCPLKHGMEGHRKAFAKGIMKLYECHMEKQKVDVIHAHCCVWAGYAAMLLSQKTGIPYIITEHATLFQLHRNEISNANNRIITEAFHNAARVICVSRAFANLLSDYRRDIDVIGNVVDCELFIPKEKGENQNFEFLTICYMQEEAQLYKKGIDILLRAWRNFQQICPQCRLLIGGGGHAVQKAIEWCQKYEISESVEFIGNLSREEVAQRMQQCDCFVLPSRYETFGVVYIEAMACGKPVIAVKNGGPDDFVKEFNGILIRPEDEEELKQAMLTITENKSQFDADRIAQYVKQKFSREAIAKELQAIYQNVLSS